MRHTINDNLIATYVIRKNGVTTAIVAKKGAVDWAAYIGSSDIRNTPLAYKSIAELGDKLYGPHAVAIFGEFPFGEDFPYRG